MFKSVTSPYVRLVPLKLRCDWSLVRLVLRSQVHTVGGNALHLPRGLRRVFVFEFSIRCYQVHLQAYESYPLIH
jgi:hypothetical protein